MSLEKDFIVHDTHTRCITALGCNPARREIYLGFEDGIVKAIEIDTTNHVQTYCEHKGWITGFLYWPQSKILFCSSNDGMISVIGSGGILLDKIFIGHAIYSMAMNNRRREIILGVTNGIQFHNLYETKEMFSHFIDSKPLSKIIEHTDIVRNICVVDSRIYSTGYDGALVIYDCQFAGDVSASKYFKNPRAHEAGIACLVAEKDTFENAIWIFTGSFDKTLKVWTGDGKIIHKFDGFNTGVTGLSYAPRSRTIWAAAGSNTAFIFDPKSGEDVTEFIDTFNDELHSNHTLQLLKYSNEFNILLTTTSRKQLIVYKYNSNGCLTSLKYKSPIDAVCYTSKVPLLIFTGDSNGKMSKWEQRQASQIIYASEDMIKSELVMRESSRMQGMRDSKSRNEFLKKDLNQIKKTNIISKMLFVEKLDLILAACEDSGIYVWGFDQEAVKILKNMNYDEVTELKKKKKKNKSVVISHQKDQITPVVSQRYEYFEKINYIEYLNSLNTTNQNLVNSLNQNFLREPEKPEKPIQADESESVTNRVAGFILKKIFNEHNSCVTALAVIERPDLYKTTYLVSSGWDRRICIWDLERLRLFDVFKNSSSNFEEVEMACDGNVIDMCYCSKDNTFAYSSTDSMCYIRKFSERGSEMVLVNTLQGHHGEVNVICWYAQKSQWITGGEDTTIRIWNEHCECIQVINCTIIINSICVDYIEDALIVACHDLIKVYEMDEFQLVQTNHGHHDSIRDIIFIPERQNIVSVSWDGTIKIWRSYRKQKNEKKQEKNENNKKFETWVWDQMKVAMRKQNPFDLKDYSEKLSCPAIIEADEDLVVSNLSKTDSSTY